MHLSYDSFIFRSKYAFVKKKKEKGERDEERNLQPTDVPRD